MDKMLASMLGIDADELKTFIASAMDNVSKVVTSLGKMEKQNDEILALLKGATNYNSD